MSTRRKKTHLVVVKVRVDKPMTEAEARWAVWAAIDTTEIDGRGDPASNEPWSKGIINVSRSAPRGPKP